MASDLRPLEIYSAGGIDQSENPRPDSVRDACNMDTSKGLWAVRPGWMEAWGEYHPITTLHPRNAIEYIPDRRFAGSRYYAIIYALADDGTLDSEFFFFEKTNSETTRRMLTQINYPKGPQVAKWQKYYTMAKGLWRYVDAPDESFWYVPVIVFSNGEDPPLVYHQLGTALAPPNGGQGDMHYLDAVDGGDESLTYLDEPPRAKVYCTYKDRLFALNCLEGDNVVFNTGLYEFAAYVVNVWPAEYNFSVGDGSEITGARVLNDVLYIFKKREIWALSGDGIDGNWQLEKVNSEHGAFNNDSIVDVGGSLIFLGGYGEAFYRFDGNSVRNISHPRLQEVWKEYYWHERDHLHINGAYEESSGRVMFVCGQHQDNPFGMLVYNLETDTWDRWGDWPGNPHMPSNWNLPYKKNQIPQILFQSKKWYNDRSVVMGLHNTLGTSLVQCTTLKGNLDAAPQGGITAAPHWYLITHRYFRDDSYSKMLEQMMVYAKMTGDWEMTLLALKDDETLEQAIRRGSKDLHNVIEDSANVATHLVAGLNQFLDDTVHGPVDVYFLPTLHKLYDSKAIVDRAQDDYIQFVDALSSIDMNGMLLVLKENKAKTKLITMCEPGDPIYNGNGVTWGNVKWKEPQFKRLTRGENVEGRCFSLFMSNVGSYYDDTWKHWAPLNSGRCEIKGWGLWVRRHAIMAQQRRSFTMPSY